MNAVIVSVGTELVIGQCVDTNSAWLSAELTRHGAEVKRHITVGDDLASIEATVRAAMSEAPLIIVTGGLGPTADDVTRQALAGAVNEPLEENPEALAQICSFFEQWQRPMSDSNRLQALAPRGSKILANRRGTAPGIEFSRHDRHIFALPGVPSEMKLMFDEWVRPDIGARHLL
jgi:nicotinamide-nucleotide amidase